MGIFGDFINSIKDKVVDAVESIKDKIEESKNEDTKPSSTPYPKNINDIKYLIRIDELPRSHAEIYDEKGNLVKIHKDCYNYNGALYDAKTGKILADYHGPSGKYDKDRYNSKWDQENNTAYFYEKKNPYNGGSGGGGGNWIPEVIVPPPPPKIEFNEPFPSFSSNVKKIDRYSTHFGVDKVFIKNVEYSPESVFVSSVFAVTGDYIMLDATYTGNVEFYFVDGKKDVPILPIGLTQIEEEKLFFNQSTRFAINNSFPVIIKQDFKKTDFTYEAIINNVSHWSNHTYSISYTPILQNTYVPYEKSVLVKAILRSEDASISRLSIRYYIENQDKIRW